MEHDLPDEPTEIPLDMWLYGAHQPLRIGAADAESSSSSSFSSMSFLAKLELTQERSRLRRSEMTSLLLQASCDLKALQKTTDFRATLDAARLRLERCQETGSSTVLELSLTGSDMMWVPVARKLDETGGCGRPGWILAIAPKASLSSREENLGKAWLFCVGDCSPDIFHQALFDFGRAGAIRSDFEETYELEDVVDLGLRSVPKTLRIGKTFTNARFAGKPDIVAVELADETSSLHRQLSILARLRTHPNIVKFHGAFYQSEGDKLMLTFQHAPRDLATRIELVGALEQSRCLEVLFGTLRGVAHLHHHRIAHRNLHPRVVCLGRPGQVAIACFDAAVSIDDHDAMRTLAGTPGFVAPEVISRRPYGVKADVFSCGSIYFTAATGEEPFRDAHNDDGDGDDGDARVLKRTLEGAVDFEKPKFKKIQYTLQFLVKAMLHDSPRARPSAADAAADCWQLLSPAQMTNLQAAFGLEGAQGQGQHFDIEDTVSRTSSKSSVLSGALPPQSVLEQQERLPNLEVLEEATSSQERSSRSSPFARATPQSQCSSAKSSPHEPVQNSLPSPITRERELAADPQVAAAAPSIALALDQASLGASDAPDPVASMTPAPAAAQGPGSLFAMSSRDNRASVGHAASASAQSAIPGNRLAQPPGLDRTNARPASSSAWSVPSWPLRALSRVARRARWAGSSLRQSMWSREKRSADDDLSPLVPQDTVSAPEPRRQRNRHVVRSDRVQPE